MTPLFYVRGKEISAELPITQRAFKTRAAEGMSKIMVFITLIVYSTRCSVYKFDALLNFHIYCSKKKFL